MDQRKRKIIEGWIDKAGNQLQGAKDRLNAYNQYSESVQASQECVELSVKSILSLLKVEYSAAHGWTREQFLQIAKQIQDKHLLNKLGSQHLEDTIRLPRLLLLANFWSQFYLPAKYGFEAGCLAPPQDLFGKEEADLAVHHAEECYRAALQLRYLDQSKMAVLVS